MSCSMSSVGKSVHVQLFLLFCFVLKQRKQIDKCTLYIQHEHKNEHNVAVSTAASQ